MKCIVVDDDKLARLVIEKYIKKTDYLELAASFGNALDAFNFFNNGNSVDLIFLDIEMPGMSGVDFLEITDNLPQIVVISAKEKYALQAIEHDVTDYLIKPVTMSRFLKAASKAKQKFEEENEKQNSEGIFLKSSNSIFVRFFYDDVLFVEAMENYVAIQTTLKKYTIHFTMKAMLDKLPEDKFVRIHRSFIINIDKIDRIDNNMIYLHTLEKKPFILSKSYKDNLLKKLNIFNN